VKDYIGKFPNQWIVTLGRLEPPALASLLDDGQKYNGRYADMYIQRFFIHRILFSL
jgi:hypothetical protein